MRIFTFYFFVLLFNNSFSQEVTTLGDDKAIIDSLKQIIATSKNDSVICYNHLKTSGFYFKNRDIENYNYHLAEGKKYSKKYKFLRLYATYFDALIYLNESQIDKYFYSIKEILPELKRFDNNISKELQLILIQNLSTFYINNSKDRLSIEVLINEGIPLAKKEKNNTILAMMNESIARSFFNLEQFEKANKYYEEAIKVYKSSKKVNFEELSICYIYSANNLLSLNKFEQALKYLNESKKLFSKFKENNIWPHYYYTLGNYNSLKGFNELALEKYAQGVKSLKASNSSSIERLLKSALAETYYKLGEYKQSLNLLLSIEKEITKIEEISFYENMYKAYEKLDDYKLAFTYSQKYLTLKDSIDKSKKELEFNRIEAKFNTSEKEKRILQLEKEKNERENKLKTLRLWYISVLAIFAIILLLFYALLKNYRNQKKINNQQQMIHLQKMNYLNSQKEIEIMQAMIDGEESERKRIARDLHDGIGSRLSSLKMQLNRIESKYNNTIDEIEDLSDGLSKSISDLRRTAFNLVPETLSKLGLELALKDLCFSMSNPNVTILFTSNEIKNNIIKSNQTTIFRIVQELINNALKHSNCTEIIVDCSQNGQLFLITVEDNGIGFSTNDLKSFSGLGLKNIKSRVDLLRGNIDYSSSQNKGTIFNIELQVQTENEDKL